MIFFSVLHYSNILLSAVMLPCFHVTTPEEKKAVMVSPPDGT